MLESPTHEPPTPYESPAHEPPAHEPPMHNSAQRSRVLYSAGSEPVDPRARSLANAFNRAEGDAIDAYPDEDDPFFCDGDGDGQGKSYCFIHHSI